MSEKAKQDRQQQEQQDFLNSAVNRLLKGRDVEHKEGADPFGDYDPLKEVWQLHRQWNKKPEGEP